MTPPSPGATAQTPDEGRATTARTGRTILVVDDDERLLRVVSMYLSIEGYRVISAADGPAAFAALGAERPDLVIMDIMMPGIDGVEACTRIRANPETATLPVLLFSALSSSEDAERARLAGANHLITKPFNLVGLAGIVNSYCAPDGTQS